MPFFTDHTSGIEPERVDIKAEGYILIDFLRCVRRDADDVKSAALPYWSFRESWFGSVAVKDGALATMVGIPADGEFELVTVDKNDTLLSARLWCRVDKDKPLPPGPRKVLDNIVIHDTGEFVRSRPFRWLNPCYGTWTGVRQVRGDLNRWYADFVAGLEPAAPIEI